MQIDGVSRPEGGTTSLYALPVGIARLIVDLRGNRKYPNCTWAARPDAGPNAGLLTIFASTHNRSGIACGSPVVVDFGASYAPSPAPSPEAKRFKADMENTAHLLDNTRQQLNEEADTHTAAGKGSSSEDAPAAGPRLGTLGCASRSG